LTSSATSCVFFMGFTLRLHAVLLVTAGLFSAGCKQASVPLPSKTALLTAHPWHLRGLSRSVTTNGVTQQTQLVFDLSTACYLDDELKFEANQTVALNQGQVHCQPGTPQVSAGTWAFASGEADLVVQTGSRLSGTYQLEMLTPTILEVVQTTSVPATAGAAAQTVVEDLTYTTD
jgi:hypothetical protein